MSLVPARRSGWLLEPRRKSGPRGMAAASATAGVQNPAYRPSGNDFSRGDAENAEDGQHLFSATSASPREPVPLPAEAG